VAPRRIVQKEQQLLKFVEAEEATVTQKLLKNVETITMK